ncbi:hypothetical protein CsSME_00007136 [Camellia sinensis var. sinensis]
MTHALLVSMRALKNACSFRYSAVEVDVTLQPEELEVMNNVLHAKYEEAKRRRSCVVSGRISVTWLPRCGIFQNEKKRKRKMQENDGKSKKKDFKF